MDNVFQLRFLKKMNPKGGHHSFSNIIFSLDCIEKKPADLAGAHAIMASRPPLSVYEILPVFGLVSEEWPYSKRRTSSLPLASRSDFLPPYFLNGTEDYWETPAEFFAHGGDCEDFFLAKYFWLRFLGVPEERLRIAIVYDRLRNVMHSVLILDIDGREMILDNQVEDIRDSAHVSRYRMIYSLNRFGWWYPTFSEDARIGSAVPPISRECLAGASSPKCINAIETSSGEQ